MMFCSVDNHISLVDDSNTIKDIFETQFLIGVRRGLAQHYLHKADACLKTHLRCVTASISKYLRTYRLALNVAKALTTPHHINANSLSRKDVSLSVHH